MEYLPLGRIAALVPEFAVKVLLLGRTLIVIIYIYTHTHNMGSELDSFLKKRCFLFCFVYVVLLISLEIMRKKNCISRFILQGCNIIFKTFLRVRCMYACKVICPIVGLSLDMYYQGIAYLSLQDKRKE